MPGWPLPAFCTASMASTRALSTARRSRSVQSRAESVTTSSRPLVDGGAGDPTTPARACGQIGGVGGCSRAGAERLRKGSRKRPRPGDPEPSRTAGERPLEAGPAPLACHAPPPPRLEPPGVQLAAFLSRRTRGRRDDRRPTTWCRTTGPRCRRCCPRRGAGPAGRSRAAAFVALTKPRIIELLLVTTVPTMFFAARGLPPLWLVVGDARGRHAGGRQRQHAELLPRPRHRRAHAPHASGGPLVTGEVTPREALVFGLVARRRRRRLCSRSLVNVLSAGLALAAILFYVVVYTMILKRRTPQNIVWGGAAGCMPVLIGWAAVTGLAVVGGRRAVRRDLPLDAAALLAAVDEVPRRLRRGAASRCCRWSPRPPRSSPQDRRLRVGDGGRARCCSCPLGGAGPVYAVCRPRRRRAGSLAEAHLLLAPGPAPARRSSRRCGSSTSRSPT